jgi:hypothetical protein
LGVVEFLSGGGIMAFIEVIDCFRMGMIDRVVSVIGLHHYGDVVRRVVELLFIW